MKVYKYLYYSEVIKLLIIKFLIESCFARDALQLWQEGEIGAVVIVPSRELAKQVGGVCNVFADALSLSTRVLIGGKKGKCDSKAVKSLRFFSCRSFFKQTV